MEKEYDYILLSNGGNWLKYGGKFVKGVDPEVVLEDLWDDDCYYSGKEYCFGFEYSVSRQGDASFENANYRVFRFNEVGVYQHGKFQRFDDLKDVDVEEMDYRLNKRFLDYDDEEDEMHEPECDDQRVDYMTIERSQGNGVVH